MQDWIGKKRRSDKLFEDELTSCVFGPLRYMEPGKAWEACLMVFELSGCMNLSQKPTHVCVHFWPNFPRTDEEGLRVEPDIHIVAWSGNTLLRTILIETKWNSPLGQSQLLDQWRFITADGMSGSEVRDHSTHAFVSKRPLRDADSIKKQRKSAKEEGMGWGDRLIVFSWYQIATRLLGLRGLHGSIEIWRQDLVEFLARHGITPFDGFHFDQFDIVGLMQWRFDDYLASNLLKVELLDWSFNRGNAA